MGGGLYEHGKRLLFALLVLQLSHVWSWQKCTKCSNDIRNNCLVKNVVSDEMGT